MTEVSALRLKGVKKNFIKVRGRRVFYLEKGAGEPVILVHGWMGSSVDYPQLFPFLSEKFRTIIPDLPGFGESERMPHSRIDDYAEFLKDFAEALDLKDFFLVGNCFGATIALDFVIKFPKMVRKVALFTPIYSPSVLRKRWRTLFLLLKPRYFRHAIFWLFRRDKVLRAGYSLIFRHSRGAYKEDAILKKKHADWQSASEAALDLRQIDLTEKLGEIRLPVMIFVFKQDGALVPSAIEKLQKLIPHAVLVKIDEGHFVDPDLMIPKYKKITEFFHRK